MVKQTPLESAVSGNSSKITSLEEETADHETRLAAVEQNAGGGNLYAHHLYIKNFINVVIYSTNPNPMTTQELANYLKNAKLNSYSKYYPATGETSTDEMIIGFFIDTTNIFNYVAIGKSTKTISINGENVTVVSSVHQMSSTMGGISYVTLTDNVVQL
jgi:hypothetical protein